MSLNLEFVSPRFGETLYVMVQASRTLINDMYLCRKIRPTMLKNKSVDALCKSVCKKFPTLNTSAWKSKEDDIKPADLLQSLDIYYNGLVYLGKFRLLVNTLMLTLGQTINTITLKLSSDLLLLILEIVSNYVCSFLFFTKIEDIKSIVGLYAASFEQVNKKTEPNFNGIVQFLNDYSSKPFRKLVDEFENFVPKIQAISESMLSELQLKCIDAEQMKAGFTYSILSNSHELAIPPLCNYPMLQLIPGFELMRWFYFCIVVCPTAVQPGSAIERILFLILTNFEVVQLHKDEFVDAKRDLVNWLELLKGTSKLIKFVNDNHNSSGNIMINHRNKRQHIKNILMETVPLIQDQPGLLGPKFIQLITLYRAAVAELSFYAVQMLPESFKLNKKKELEVPIDPDLCVVLHYLIILKNLFMNYKFIVHNYFHQFLIGHDKDALKHISETIKFTAFEKICFDENISFLENLPQVEYGVFKDDMGVFKLYVDWIRVQNKIVDKNSVSSLPKYTHALATLNNLSFHALVVDDVTGFLQRQLDITPVVFHHKLIEAVFREAYDEPGLTYYLLSVPTSLQHFDPNSSYVGSQEIQMFYELHLAMISNYMESFSAKVFLSFSTLLQTLMHQYVNLSESTTSLIWLNSTSSAQGSAKVNFPLPHSYSDELLQRITNFGTLSEEELLELDVFWNMASSVGCFPQITLGGLVFNVAMWMAPHVEESLLKTIKRIFIPSQDGMESQFEIRKPSMVLSLLKSMFEGLTLMSDILQCDFNHIFASILLGEGLMTEVDNENVTLTCVYSDWYIDNILSKKSRSEGMLYSPVRKCFVVKVSSPLPIEEFTDIQEITALASIIGPFGISAICDKLMKMIVETMDEIRKIMIPYEGHMTQGIRGLSDPSFQFDEFYKRWKCIDDVVMHLIQIGMILEFKGLLLDGLRRSQNTTSSSILQEAIKIKYGTSDALKTMPLFIEITAGSVRGGDSLVSYFKGTDGFVSMEAEFWLTTFLNALSLILPYFATKEGIQYLPLLGAHTSNLHLIVTSINNIVFPVIKLYETNSRSRDMLSTLQGFYDNIGLAMLRISNGTLFSAPIKCKEAVIILYDKIDFKGFKANDPQNTASIDSLKSARTSFNPTEIVPYSLVSSSYSTILQSSRGRRRRQQKPRDVKA